VGQALELLRGPDPQRQCRPVYAGESSEQHNQQHLSQD
jgi:hypothetical protein